MFFDVVMQKHYIKRSQIDVKYIDKMKCYVPLQLVNSTPLFWVLQSYHRIHYQDQ